jgi:RNA polymerase sigma factor (sigma-70 family)
MAGDEPSPSVNLLQQLQGGDKAAAEAIFQRYVERLTRLARSRLSAKLAARVDPEDIIQSAYRSFFMAARQGRFVAERGGDLWRLLVEVVLHKLYRQVEHHTAQRRSVERERQVLDSRGETVGLPDKTPTPAEAAAAVEELEAILQQLSERGRQTLELRLQGYQLEEIAERLGCNERTVRRWLSEARRIMAARGGQGFVPSAARQGPAAGWRPLAAPANLSGIEAPLPWSDFVLEEQIGIGATGKVYRALQRSRGVHVAIKFLKKPLTREPAVVERFLREAKTVAQLAHPGIVAIQGAGRTPGGGVFLVMDLVHGRDLSRVAGEREIGPYEAVAWVAEAANIIEFAFQHGVIHCDLKPSNLLLEGSGRIRVTDFGLALGVAEANSDRGILAGTPAYMAPEQVDPCWGAISSRTDVWGLGGVLYFLVVGQPPHVGHNVPDVLAQVVTAKPVSFPDDDRRPVPHQMLAVLKRCLAKQPGERFATAGELSAALNTFVAAR